MTDFQNYALNHWGKHETDAEHAERVESVERQASWFFEQATKPQRAAYNEAMAGLRGLHAPKYDRLREAAKARWERSTAEASELFYRTADALMRDGEVSESLSAEWDALCAKRTEQEAA